MPNTSRAAAKCHWRRQAMLGMIVLGFTSALWAQSAPTADQLKIFNSLDPATQQTILQNMGQGNAATGNTQSDTKTNAGDQRRRGGNVNKQAESALAAVLKSGDTVLINIDFVDIHSLILRCC